jgi:hypothetical protein
VSSFFKGFFAEAPQASILRSSCGAHSREIRFVQVQGVDGFLQKQREGIEGKLMTFNQCEWITANVGAERMIREVIFVTAVFGSELNIMGPVLKWLKRLTQIKYMLLVNTKKIRAY